MYQSPKPHSKLPKNKLYNNFSITVRTGRGINLGLDSSRWETFIRGQKHCPEEYIVVVEKEGIQAHWQTGFRFSTPLRLDTVKDRVLKLFQAGDPFWTPANTLHSVMVKGHDQWPGLVGYCLKDLDVADGQFPEMCSLQQMWDDSDQYYIEGSRWSKGGQFSYYLNYYELNSTTQKRPVVVRGRRSIKFS